MFKRVERKRKRREEEEELGLDQDTRVLMGLNDTDSDESDSGSEDESTQYHVSDADTGEDRNQEEGVASENDGLDEDPSISVAEALENPIYLISLDPATVHGCVVCKGKIIKDAGMATAHKNSKAHKRRFERFRLLSANVDRRSNAWELARTIPSASNTRAAKSQEMSKRALKRQARQAAVWERRKRHKELKAKAIAKKALKKLSTADETTHTVRSGVNLRTSESASQNHPEKSRSRKKQKLDSKTSTGTITETRDMTAKPTSRSNTSSNSKKSILKSKPKSTE